MREILFRGKDLRGIWQYGYIREVWSDKKPRFVMCPAQEFTRDGWTDLQEVEVQADTIGQYTGMVDTRGTKIFEGDIVLHVNFPKGSASVHFENGCFMCGKVRANNFHSSAIEVIGNIHDNPELLEDPNAR